MFIFQMTDCDLDAKGTLLQRILPFCSNLYPTLQHDLCPELGFRLIINYTQTFCFKSPSAKKLLANMTAML